MATLADLQNTPKWKTADESRRATMLRLWDENPDKRDVYLGLANSLPSSTPSPGPVATPLPAAPGRQLELPINAPYLASGLGLAGSLAATALAPEATLPALAARIAAPTIMGAVGGALDPRDTAWEGALREAGAQLGGEALGKLGAGTMRMVRGARARTKDLGNIATAIGDAVPWLKKAAQPTVESITRLFRSGAHPESAQAIAGQALGKAKDAIEKSVGLDTPFQFPALTKVLASRPVMKDFAVEATGPRTGMSFREVDALLEDLRQMASRSDVEMKSHQAIELRKQAKDVLKEFVDRLNKVAPGAGTQYREARRQYATMRTLQNLFEKKGVVDASGNLDMSALQRVIQNEPRLAKRFGYAPIQKVIRVIGRGDIPVGEDVPLKFPIHWYPGHRIPYLQRMQLPRTVGVPKAITRRTGMLLPAGLTAAEAYEYFTNPPEGSSTGLPDITPPPFPTPTP